MQGREEIQLNEFVEGFEDYDARADDIFSTQELYLKMKMDWLSTYRKLIKVFCTSSKNSDTEVVDKLP